jgi:hypothetical protein
MESGMDFRRPVFRASGIHDRAISLREAGIVGDKPISIYGGRTEQIGAAEIVAYELSVPAPCQ